LTSIGTPIDGVGSGGFRVTEKGRTGNNLATDKDRGQIEVVLSGVKGTERDTD